MNKTRLGGLPLVIFASACWSTGGIFITRIINGSSITPIGLAFWRDLSTFAILLISISILRPDLLRVKRRDLPWLAGTGIVSIGLFHTLWNTSIILNGMAIATIIQCNATIFVIIFARLIWKEPLTRFKITAILLSTLGTILIARIDNLGGMNVTLTGLLIGLASAIAYGSVSLFGKKLSDNYSPWTILVYAFGFGTLTLLPFQITSPTVSLLPVVIPFASFILLTTIGGYMLYFTGLRWLPASIAAILATSEVLFAAIMAYLFLGEYMSIWQVLGAILVVGGVVLISLPQQEEIRISKGSRV